MSTNIGIFELPEGEDIDSIVATSGDLMDRVYTFLSTDPTSQAVIWSVFNCIR